MENNVREQGLSLVLLWKLLWKNVFSIIYFMIVGIVLSVVYTQFIAKPSYSASGNIENIGAVSTTLMQTIPTIVKEDLTLEDVFTNLAYPEAEKETRINEIKSGLSVSTYNTTTLKITVTYAGSDKVNVEMVLNEVIDITIARFVDRNATALAKIQKQSNPISAGQTGLSDRIVYVAFVIAAAFFGFVISVGSDLMKRKVLFGTDILEYNLPSNVISVRRPKKDKTPIIESKPFKEGLLELQDRVEGAARRNKARVIGLVNLGYETYDTLSALLAENMTAVGLKTVIVDLDFENPQIHTIFGIDQKSSVTNILSGGSTTPVMINKGVYALPTGNYAYPARFLKDERLKALVRGLQEKFDYVIVNVPKTDYYASILFNFGLIDSMIINVSFEGTLIRDLDEYISNIEPGNREALFINAIDSSAKSDFLGFLKKKKTTTEVN